MVLRLVVVSISLNKMSDEQNQNHNTEHFSSRVVTGISVVAIVLSLINLALQLPSWITVSTNTSDAAGETTIINLDSGTVSFVNVPDDRSLSFKIDENLQNLLCSVTRKPNNKAENKQVQAVLGVEIALEKGVKSNLRITIPPVRGNIGSAA